MSDPNSYSKRFYQIYSEALGVLNLERNEDIELDEEIELDDNDYEGDNEEVIRMTPGEGQAVDQEDEDLI